MEIRHRKELIYDKNNNITIMKRMRFALCLLLGVLFAHVSHAQVVIDNITYSHTNPPYTVSANGTVPPCGAATGTLNLCLVTNTLPAGTVFTILGNNSLGNTYSLTRTTTTNGQLFCETFTNLAGSPTGVFYTFTVKTPKIPPSFNDSTYLAVINFRVISTNNFRATLNVTNPICPSPPNRGSATVNISSGTPPYTYTWTVTSPSPNPGNSPNAINQVLGPIEVYVRDATGCDTTMRDTLRVQKPNVSLSANPNPVCRTNIPPNVLVTWTANGSPAGGRYYWDGSAVPTTVNTVSTLVTTFGNYSHSVVYEDPNGCLSDPVTVTVPADIIPTGNVTPLNTSVCPGQTVNLTGSVTTCSMIGATPCQFSFNGGTTYQMSSSYTTPPINRDTTLIVYIRNGSGCRSNAIIVNIDTLGKPRANITVNPNPVCPNNSSSVTVTLVGCVPNCTNYSTQFNGGTPVFGSPNTFTTPVVASTTSFPIRVVDNNSGCVLDTSATLNVFNNTITITPSDPNPLCANNTTSTKTLTASGFQPGTISWASTPPGLPGHGATTASIVISSPNPGPVTYTLTGIDLNGCPRTNTYNINVNPQPNVTAMSPVDHCEGTTTLLSANGASTYQWYNSTYSTLLGSPGATLSVSPTANSTYHVIGTDGNGCRDTATINVIFRPRPTGTASASPNPICAGNNSTITVTPNMPFNPAVNWVSYNNGATYTNTHPQTIGPFSTTTTVNIRIRDIYGCESNTIPTTVTVQPFSATVSNATAQCSYSTNGSATITVSGGTPNYEYSIDAMGGPYTVASSNPFTISGISPGPHIIYIRDNGNNCNTSTLFNVTTPPELNATITSFTNVNCLNANSGTFTVTTTGGTPGYTYSPMGTPSGGNMVYSGLAVGSYRVIVTDNNGCKDTVNQNISGSPEPTVTASSVPASGSICQGSSITLNATATGGTGAYTYTWNALPAGPNQNGASISVSPGVGVTTYRVIAVDAQGCDDTTTINVTVNANPSVSAVVTGPATVCSGVPVNISATPSPMGPGTYSFDGGVNFFASNTYASANIYSDTTFRIFFRDANGCTSAPFLLNVTLSPFTFNLTATNASCSGFNGSLNINSVTGGNAPYQYSINGSVFTAFTPPVSIPRSGSASGTSYTVTVRDNNSPACNATRTAVIFEPQPIQINLISHTNRLVCFGNTNGQIVTAASGGTPGYTYTLSPGGTSNATGTFTGLGGGTYSVSVTDANSCPAATVTNIQIQEPPLLNPPAVSATTSCFGASTGSLTITSAATGGWGGYTYALVSPPQAMSVGVPVTNLASSTYTVRVTDAEGCTANTTVNVASYPALNLNVTVVQSDCGTGGSITLNGASGGAGAPYTFTKNGNSVTPIDANTNLNLGATITYTVSDPAGCNATRTYTVTDRPRAIPYITITPNPCSYSNVGVIRIDSLQVFSSTSSVAPPFTYSISRDVSNLSFITHTGIPYVQGNTAQDGDDLFNQLFGGNYIMQLGDNACPPQPLDSFYLHVSSGVYTTIRAQYDTLTDPNGEYAKIYVPAPPAINAGSIAYASDINQANGSVYIYDITGGTTFPNGSYEFAVDNPSAFQAIVPNSVTYADNSGTPGNHTLVTFEGLAPGPHNVYIRDARGCEDTIHIIVPGKFYIPNLVTPNGDNNNDRFFIESLPDNTQLRIYNRWGDRIYYNKKYDNSYTFSEVGDGVYYYDLELEGGTRFKGWVQVIKN
ncbi:MAG: gliding motility-associated C-terminal domain-containing protein [Cytophagaceae bacterium]|nr:gliding motility-associated C-terminal domain-containing protein [Cytophagaceae bacterium]MDW8456003.1 gliding motility-associated C-terminal domain-containing protein [Cytophagaceae bacterium]